GARAHEAGDGARKEEQVTRNHLTHPTPVALRGSRTGRPSSRAVFSAPHSSRHATHHFFTTSRCLQPDRVNLPRVARGLEHRRRLPTSRRTRADSMAAKKKQPGSLRVEPLEDRAVPSVDVRSYDGSGNNAAHPDWGKAGADFLRKAPA